MNQSSGALKSAFNHWVQYHRHLEMLSEEIKQNKILNQGEEQATDSIQLHATIID